MKYTKYILLIFLIIFIIINFDKRFIKVIAETKKESSSLGLITYDGAYLWWYDVTTLEEVKVNDQKVNYEYQVHSELLNDTNAGKIHRARNSTSKWTMPTSTFSEEYIYKEIESPFDKKSVLLIYNDYNNKSRLEVIDGDVLKSINPTDLDFIDTALPLGWIDNDTIILGNFIKEVRSFKEIYSYNINSSKATKVKFTDESDIYYDGLITTNQIGYFLTHDLELLKVDFTTNTELIRTSTQSYFIIGLGTIDDAKKMIEKRKESIEKSKFFNINSEKKIFDKSGVNSFMYWPVPENHIVACGIGCYDGHIGIDIGVNINESTAIRAVASGEVIAVVNTQPHGNNRTTSPANGNYVIIKHNFNEQDFYSVYLHLSSSISVIQGSTVSVGSIVGYGSNSGYTCGYDPVDTDGCLGYPDSYYHLHFEVWGSCGNGSCWLNPYNEELWIRDGNGNIVDPPTSKVNCNTNDALISGYTHTPGNSMYCNGHNSLTLQESTLLEGSYFRGYIY